MMTLRLEALGGLGIFQDRVEVAALPGRPVRCGLFVYLAVERTATRDELATVFWSNRADEHARHSLSQTLYELRSDLGDKWVRGKGQRLEIEGAVSCDAGEFQEAVDTGAYDRAVSLYGGAFLEGCHLASSTEFQAWVDRWRSRLRRLYRMAQREQVAALRDGSDPAGALAAAQRWVDLEPLDDEANHALLELLVARGLRSEALHHYEVYRELLERELEVDPLEETRDLLDTVRAGEAVSSAPALKRAAPKPDPRSVAVLPFSDLGPGKEHRYFSDGITEEIIARLARLPGIHVIARTSVMRYRDTDREVREVAEELGVATVLEGTVRLAGDRVRIGARLVDGRSGAGLVSEIFDRELEDVLRVQTEVAERIAEVLAEELGADERARLGGSDSSSVEAYDQYLKARYLWNQRTPETLKSSVTLLREAVAEDPSFAPAHVGLAEAHLMRGIYGFEEPGVAMPAAREAAETALELDPRLGEAHAVLGTVGAMYKRDWADAEAEFDRSVDLTPGSAIAHQWRAVNLLAPLGRFHEAHRALRRARRLDPLSLAIWTSSGVLNLFQGEYDRAALELRHVLDQDEAFGLAHFFLGQLHLARGAPDEALPFLRRAVDLSGGSVETTAMLGYALSRCEKEVRAREILRDLLDRDSEVYVSPVRLAHLHWGLGERERATAGIRRGAEIGAPDLVWVSVNPVFEGIRAEPEVSEALGGVGLR